MKKLSEKINEALNESKKVILSKSDKDKITKAGFKADYIEKELNGTDKESLDSSTLGYPEFINKMFKDRIASLNESKNPTLDVYPSSKGDHKKLKSWLDKSDFHAEEENDYFSFSTSGQSDADSLEIALEKEFVKAGISARFELNESLNESSNWVNFNPLTFDDNKIVWGKSQARLRNTSIGIIHASRNQPSGVENSKRNYYLKVGYDWIKYTDIVQIKF